MIFNTFLRLTFTALLTLLALGATAQKYRTAAGVRIGRDNFGVTVQQKVFERTTLEGIGLVGTREVSATLLAEQHFGLLGKSLNYYLGAGAHVGVQKNDGGFGGVDAIAGVEYKIAFVPVVLSLDVKPSVEISNSDDWFRFPAALSVRYILIKDKKEGFLNNVFGDGNDRDDRRRQREKEQKKRDRDKKDAPRRGLFDF
ncbi:hypothetical protein ACW9KT_20670 [Hymenobacter sp. HD11105]